MYIAGIDEVGRGPLAGPVTVGVAWVQEGVDVRALFSDVADSKVLTEELREDIYERVLNTPEVSFTVAHSSVAVINEFGIERAVQKAIHTVCEALPLDTFIYLDGRLKAADGFQQETIVRGDASVPIISLAAIMAKVERDRLMKEMGKTYPEYGFAKHKGYGTKAHREAVLKYGLCEIHRSLYCRNLLNS